MEFLKGILQVIFLPFALIASVFYKKPKLAKKILSLIAGIVLIPVWTIALFLIAGGIHRIGQEVGVFTFSEYVSGTGSMYPTFPKGKGKTEVERMEEVVGLALVQKYPGGIVLFGRRFLGYQLQRGDIVTFANNQT